MVVDDAGKRLAYVEGKGRLRTVMHDKRALGSYDMRKVTVRIPPEMSSDGSRVAYQLRDEATGKEWVMFGGKAGPKYDFIGNHLLSADGSLTAYVGHDESRDESFVHVGKEKRGPHEWVTKMTFTGDGNLLAYAAETEEGWRAFIGDRVVPCPPSPYEISVSAQGAICYVVGVEGKGRRIRHHDTLGPIYKQLDWPTWDPSGKRVAYRAVGESGSVIVVSGRESPAPGMVSRPMWSEDGASIGYGARLENELWWKVARLD